MVMIEQIGNVKLDYTFYSGNDYYSDGDEIENQLLNIVKNGNREDALKQGNSWPILYHLTDMRKNLIEWYPFHKDGEVLEIGSGCGAISGILCDKVKEVTCIELSKRRSMINAYRNRDCNNLKIMVGNFKDIRLNKKFDYITLIGVLEYAALYIGGDKPYKKMLNEMKKYLKPNGKILIAIENKMGFKYLNGAREDHVGQRFAGIEDYRFFHGIRTFSKPELEALLGECKYKNIRFYYPSPDYKLPDTIYSDARMPNRGEVRIWNMNYSETRIALYNDAIMADQICRDKVFDYFANSFLAVVNDDNEDVYYAHYRRTCKKEFQIETLIQCKSGKQVVSKSYLWDVERNYDILERMKKWYPVLQTEYTELSYLIPHENGLDNGIQYDYIAGMCAEEEAAKYVHNIDQMIRKFKQFIKKYYAYDENWLEEFTITDEYRKVFGDVHVDSFEKSLKVTNLDLTLQNIILKEDRAYCIDYEWIFDFPIPCEYVIYRSASSFYNKYNMYFLKELSKNDFLVKVGVKAKNISIYNKMEEKFQEMVYGKNREENYLKNYVKPSGMIELKGL